MATIKEYNNKLRSLRNTQKITKTMKMVSASKLRKAQHAQMNAKLYAHSLTHMITRLSATIDTSSSPLLMPHENVKKIHVVIFTSDKGLCGAFNNNAIKNVLAWTEANSDRFEEIDLSFCGRRGYMFFQNRQRVNKYYDDITTDPDFAHGNRIGQDLIKDFHNGTYDEVYLNYNQFFSPLSQKAVFEKILPIEPQELLEEEIDSPSDYLFEPDQSKLLSFLIPHFIYFKVYFALLQNAAGEHGARMTAMDNATKNASDLIDRYTLLRNRARQASITTELIEIVAGAEALN